MNTTYTATFRVAGPALTCPTSPVPTRAISTTTVNAGISARDWVAQYTPGSPNTPWLRTRKFVPLPRPATISLAAPLTAGLYELRLFANNTFTLVGSWTFQVAARPRCPSTTWRSRRAARGRSAPRSR